MTQTSDTSSGDLIAPRALPQPIIEKRRWPITLIWAVPVIALVVAGLYYRDRFIERGGQEITLSALDATGIHINESAVAHRGVQIGKITELELNPDGNGVLIHVRLRRGNEAFAKTGAVFWMVRPEISAASVNGLSTLFSGPYIEANAGSGDLASSFPVRLTKPIATGEGVRFLLRASKHDSLEPGSPVYYRGVDVGVIEDVRLSPDATGVELPIFIRRRYAPLVRTNSVFWTVSGADVHGGLLTGVSVHVESLRSLLAGGVAFATPQKPLEDPAPAGADFPIYDEAKKDWLAWTPKIPLAPEDSVSEP